MEGRDTENNFKPSEIKYLDIIPTLPMWIIEYFWAHRMMDTLEGLPPSLWPENDLLSLSLDEPWRLRVVAAQAYSIIKNRDIKMFERVMEFLDITYKLLPRLVPPIKHMKIMFGLKSMIIMWMLQEDQGIVNTVVKTIQFFPNRLPQYQYCRQHEMNLMRKTQWDFKALAQTLAMEQSFRQAYIKDLMEEQYGECYAQKLEDRLIHYLQELESALQSETYFDRLLKHRAPMEYEEQLLLSLISCDSSSLATILKRLLHSVQSSSRCWPSTTDHKVGVVLPQNRSEVRILQSPREIALKVQSQLDKTSSNPAADLCQHNPPEQSDSLVLHHAKQCSNPQMCMMEPRTGQSKDSPLLLEDEDRTDEGVGGRPNSELVQENPPMQLCSKHQKWVKSILQECSEDLLCDHGDYNPDLESISASSLDLTPSLTTLFPPQHLIVATQKAPPPPTGVVSPPTALRDEACSEPAGETVGSLEAGGSYEDMLSASVGGQALLIQSAFLQPFVKLHKLTQEQCGFTAELRRTRTKDGDEEMDVKRVENLVCPCYDASALLRQSALGQPFVRLRKLTEQECGFAAEPRVTRTPTSEVEHDEHVESSVYSDYDVNTLYSSFGSSSTEEQGCSQDSDPEYVPS